MKKVVFLMVCMIMYGFMAGQTSNLQELINKIGEKHVPDKRIGVYTVEAVQGDSNWILRGKTSDASAYKHLVDSLQNTHVAFTDSVVVLPIAAYRDSCWAFAPTSVIYLYARPSFNAEMITQALMGTPLKLLDKRPGGWKQIQTPDGYIGWTEMYLEKISLKERTAYNAKPKVVVMAHNAFVYEKKSVLAPIVSDVVMGNILVQIPTKNNKDEFVAVSLPDGRKGYMLACEVMSMDKWKKSIRLNGDHLLKLAKEFTGLPYFWGGLSVRGVDCSGLMKSVYFMHGIILPRDASQQYYCGTPVDISQGYDQLQPGDLLFFGKENPQDPTHPKVSHVAMYNGNKTFIHSSNTVHISSLDPLSPVYDEYNHKRLVGAKRIIGATGGFWNLFEHEWYQ